MTAGERLAVLRFLHWSFFLFWWWCDSFLSHVQWFVSLYQGIVWIWEIQAQHTSITLFNNRQQNKNDYISNTSTETKCSQGLVNHCFLEQCALFIMVCMFSNWIDFAGIVSKHNMNNYCDYHIKRINLILTLCHKYEWILFWHKQ